MGDWSLLPADILVGIALKLDSIEDVLCLSAVCHSWNDVFNSTVKPAWSRANKPALPWLLLAEPEPEPEPSNTDKSNIRRVLSMSKNKCYDMILPEITEKRCWGSSCGWIVTQEFNKNVSLFNPITKAQLSLPSLYDLPTYSDYVPNPNPDPNESDSDLDSDDEGDPVVKMIEEFFWAMKVLVLKFIVLKIDEELVVFVIHYPIDSIAYARPGDKVWTEVVEPWPRNPHRPFIHGAMVWDGKVVILYTHINEESQNGEIAYCDISTIITNSFSNRNPVKAKGGYISIPYDLYGKTYQQSVRGIAITGQMYMVELAGDLLIVFRERESGIANEYEDGKPVYLWENKHCYRTINFKVFKHVSSSSSLWEQVENLGDYLLFVGDNYASALHISKAPNCQKNAIYYIDDESRDYWGNDITKVRGHDMGVFDMASGNITSFYDGANTISEYFAPIWFMPNF